LLRLLDLQQQRRTASRDEQSDRAKRADAADTNRFESYVLQRITLKQHSSVLLQRTGIGGQGFAGA
jgi:hypothetical protein